MSYFLVLAGANEGYVVLDAATWEEQSGWPAMDAGDYLEEVSWSPDGSKLLLTGEARYYMIDVATKTIDTSWDSVLPSADLANGLSQKTASPWSADGSMLFIGIADSRYGYVIDVATKTVIHTFDRGLDAQGFEIDSGVQDADFTPDGSRLFTSGYHIEEMKVYDTSTWAEETGWPDVSNPSGSDAWDRPSMDISPDGARAVAGGMDNDPGGAHVVVDIATKTIEAGWPRYDGNAEIVRFSPDGTKLLVAGDHITPVGEFVYAAYRVLDVATKTEITGFPSPPNNAAYVGEWSPDSKYIALTAGNNADEVYVVDVAAKAYVEGWPKAGYYYNALGWSPKGRTARSISGRSGSARVSFGPTR